MKEFNEDFKTKLYQTIEDIENNSLVEVVSIIRQQSERYKDIGFLLAAIVTGLIFSILTVIISAEINPYLIYLITIVTFPASYFLLMLFPSFLMLFVSKSRKEKAVEIMGRAIFQKGGIRFTEQRIGVLFFVSYIEKSVLILADRGVIEAVPQEEFDKIQAQFDEIFNSQSISEDFLKVLSSTKEIFAQYIPPVENDINELPDDLKVDL